MSRSERWKATKDKARVSTTDPGARVMKMADGGFRPAHNVPFATDTESQVITGVDVVNTGSDQGQSARVGEGANRGPVVRVSPQLAACGCTVRRRSRGDGLRARKAPGSGGRGRL